MQNNLLETLWRADRVLAGAVALVALAAGGIAGAAIVHAPHTDKSATSIVAQTPVPAMDTASVLETDPALAQLVSEHKCLSEALYYEARGEGARGQMAVAEVIFHRLHNKHYPQTICGVVYQGKGTKECQFSFACVKHAKVKNEEEWDSAQMLAAQILTGVARMNDVTSDATHFHTISVQPEWADHLVKTIQIGNHIFYRDAPITRKS
ncbi:MAG TPA: cell wall hydrolase [Rhizomicrobium sp.]|jgi:spore germination cell wall hydrolase CwlJ-like protein|nr:cell wall hydrolase [Rhizomicrobium sp.]